MKAQVNLDIKSHQQAETAVRPDSTEIGPLEVDQSLGVSVDHPQNASSFHTWFAATRDGSFVKTTFSTKVKWLSFVRWLHRGKKFNKPKSVSIQLPNKGNQRLTDLSSSLSFR